MKFGDWLKRQRDLLRDPFDIWDDEPTAAADPPEDWRARALRAESYLASAGTALAQLGQVWLDRAEASDARLRGPDPGPSVFATTVRAAVYTTTARELREMLDHIDAARPWHSPRPSIEHLREVVAHLNTPEAKYIREVVAPLSAPEADRG